MRQSRFLAIALLALPTLAPAACGGRTREAPLRRADTVEAPPAPDTAVAAGAAEIAAHVSQDTLRGVWELVTPGRLPGLRFTLAIDSLAGDRVYGRLLHYMAGDVGVEADRFAPFVGEAGRGVVRIPIAAWDGSTGFLLEGPAAGDTIRLTTFAIGPDTLRGADLRRLLIRRER